MDQRLIDYISSMTLETNDGMYSEEKDIFKNFYLSSHGATLSDIISRMGARSDARTLATPRILGFLTPDGSSRTDVGNLLFTPCINQKRILYNQYKKWHYLNRVSNRGNSRLFNIYPYWIILEFLLMASESGIDYIDNEEFMYFVSTIRNRIDIPNHLSLLQLVRADRQQWEEFKNGVPSREMFLTRFGGNYLQVILTECLEYISYKAENNQIALTINEPGFFSNQIEYFYKQYGDRFDYASDEYINFLSSNTQDNTFNIFPMADKAVSEATITKVAGNLINNFPYRNLLLKGVPGTGKSRELDLIINDKMFALKDKSADDPCLSLQDIKNQNIIRINVHSGLTNAELMQGIGVMTTTNSEIRYSEKQGLVFKHIAKAILNPSLPYVIILEEVQENNLNRLIGDLIFLIEEDRRTLFTSDHLDKFRDQIDYEYVSQLTVERAGVNKILLPSLVESGKEITLCMPANLFLFCTSNYREDKKIMEDNLLRRFEVLEIYPDAGAIKNGAVATFLTQLNESILSTFIERQDLHPDRFLIGHAIWLGVNDAKDFARAFNKVSIDFKDLKEVEWPTFQAILGKTGVSVNNLGSYKELTELLQNYYFRGTTLVTPLISNIENLFNV